MFVCFIWERAGKEITRFPLFLHPSFPLLSSSCFASMVAGGRLHGEKSGIYHFSTEGRHYKLAGHVELTACLAFSHSDHYCLSVCAYAVSSCLYVFLVFLTLIACWLNASVSLCMFSFMWVSMSEDGCFYQSCIVSRSISLLALVSPAQSDSCEV